MYTYIRVIPVLIHQLLTTFFIHPSFLLVLNLTSACIIQLHSTSLYSFLAVSGYCFSLLHTPFGLILFYMATEHQQKEHGGSGGG